MSVDENTALAMRFYKEVLNGGMMDVADEILAPQYIDHNASTPGLENFKRYFVMITSVFPDIRVTVEDIFADEDKVAARLTIRGTQSGSFRGFPAKGGHATWSGIDIIHISNGKIVERWSERDFLDMLIQLGHIEYPQ